MKTTVCAILLLLSLPLILPQDTATSQVRFKIPIEYTDSIFIGGQDPTDTINIAFSDIFRDTIWFGFHDQATICRDTLTGFTTHWTLADTGVFMEELLPPTPPSGRDYKFISIDSRQGCFSDGSKLDIRGFTGGLLRDSARFKQGADNNPIYFHREVLRWPTVLSQYLDSCRLRNLGSTPVNVDMRQEFKATSLLFNASLLASHNFKILFSNPKSVPPIPQVNLVSPANAAIGQSLAPILTWTAASGALFYRVQLSKGDPTFSPPNIVVNDSVGGGSVTRPVTGLTPGATYYWRVAVFTAGGVSYFQDPAYAFTCQTTSGVGGQERNGPAGFSLDQNYPDPFNPSTIIRYTVGVQAHVRLTVFTMLGEEVATLVDEVQQPGLKSIEFRSHDLPSGTYLYRLTAGGFTDVKRMLLVR